MPRELARDVILVALLTPLPTDSTDPGDRNAAESRAALIEAALIQHGHLTAPGGGGPTLAEVEDVARWLADQSMFARYTMDGGWKRLLASNADVNVAAAKALVHAATDDDKAAIVHAKALLATYNPGAGRG